MEYKILVIDDLKKQAENLQVLTNQFCPKSISLKIDWAQSGEDGIEKVRADRFGYACVLVDFHMDGKNGAETARELAELNRRLFIIFCTQDYSNETLQELLNAGVARGCIIKGKSPHQYIDYITRACKEYLEESRLAGQTIGKINTSNELAAIGLSGQSEALKYICAQVKKYAPRDSNVLIEGETGTGKEAIGRALHGDRPGKPYAIDCGAISETLFQSELFGHVKGAFTGADRDKAGALEIAKGGTILLDEVDNLSPTLQRALLRALQERTFRRLGETKERSFSCRIVGTAKSNISERVEDGEFLKDLYYRLNVLNIKVPPLRERNDDIEPIVSDFCLSWNENHGQDRRFHADALEKLKSNEWSGNVRELLNYLERILVDVEAPIIEALHIDRYEEIRREVNDKVFYLMHDKKLDSAKADFERLYIEEMLRRSQSQREAADRCGYSPQRLSHRIKELNILSPFAKASESMG